MKKTSGKEKVVHFSSNTARAEVKEKSESSVIWHKVKPFSHHDPKKQNTVTHRKQKKQKTEDTALSLTASCHQPRKCLHVDLKGAVREEGWTEFMSQDASPKKKKKKSLHRVGLVIKPHTNTQKVLSGDSPVCFTNREATTPNSI